MSETSAFEARVRRALPKDHHVRARPARRTALFARGAPRREAPRSPSAAHLRSLPRCPAARAQIVLASLAGWAGLFVFAKLSMSLFGGKKKPEPKAAH